LQSQLGNKKKHQVDDRLYGLSLIFMGCTLDVQNIFSYKENLCKYFYIILHGEAFADEKNRNISPGKLPLLGPENVLLDKLLHNKII